MLGVNDLTNSDKFFSWFTGKMTKPLVGLGKITFITDIFALYQAYFISNYLLQKFSINPISQIPLWLLIMVFFVINYRTLYKLGDIKSLFFRVFFMLIIPIAFALISSDIIQHLLFSRDFDAPFNENETKNRILMQYAIRTLMIMINLLPLIVKISQNDMRNLNKPNFN